jgi:photosystem II stability/assembly factor-like uncharacterized protein
VNALLRHCGARHSPWLPAALVLAAVTLLGQAPVTIAYNCPPEDAGSFGLACSEDDPCPVFLELASVEANGSTIFVTGNLHTMTTTLFGVLLASEDNGKTWSEPHARLRSAELDEIQFVDLQHGWISGVMLRPLPRDPFLLITSDGGKTWNNKPLFEDGHPGSISQFWFDSTSRGELVLEGSQTPGSRRYERYLSMTGGASWELQEASDRPLTLARARPKENASWRLAADPAAYRVEQRGTQGWETVARLAIHVGDCR